MGYAVMLALLVFCAGSQAFNNTIHPEIIFKYCKAGKQAVALHVR